VPAGTVGRVEHARELVHRRVRVVEHEQAVVDADEQPRGLGPTLLRLQHLRELEAQQVGVRAGALALEPLAQQRLGLARIARVVGALHRLEAALPGAAAAARQQQQQRQGRGQGQRAQAGVSPPSAS
jgi:hypothetical protein